jgi:hypothetical protein
MGESNHLKRFRDTLANFTAARPDDPQCEGDVLEYRLIRKQAEVLEHDSHLPTEKGNFTVRYV